MLSRLKFGGKFVMKRQMDFQSPFTHIIMCVQIIHSRVVMDNLFDRFGILVSAA